MDVPDNAAPLTRPHIGVAGRAGRKGTVGSLRPEAAGQRQRRHSLNVIAVVTLCAVVTGGSGLTAILTRSTQHSAVRSPAATCVAPQAAPVPAALATGPANGSHRLNSWGFDLLDAGTFGSVVAGPGSSLYALQACGAEETQLRVLRLGVSGNVLAESADFDRAALLTSSTVVAGGFVYVGTARLDLAGPVTDAPYELTLYLLSASNLHVLGSRRLGRGYGLSLLTSDLGHPDATVLASTGQSLLAVKAGTVSVRTLATFGQSIAQHVAADPSAAYAAVGVVAPGAVPPAAGATVELIDTKVGRVVFSARLSAGAQVESLAFGNGGLFAAIGDGMSTEVRRFAVPVLATPGPARELPTGLPATLETVSLDDTGGTLWATDLTTLACLESSTGGVLSSSQSSFSSVSVSEVVAAGPTTYGVTSSGIGVLRAPTACRLVAG